MRAYKLVLKGIVCRIKGLQCELGTLPSITRLVEC
jgi:hypothetical protein